MIREFCALMVVRSARRAAALALLLDFMGAAVAGEAPPNPIISAFSFQGQLLDGGEPANGSYSMEFRLYDVPEGGTALGSPVVYPPVPTNEGLFAVMLNAEGEFGPSAFDGNRRWLEVTVEGTALSPRQEITAAPYAMALPGLFTVEDSVSPSIVGGYAGNLVATAVAGGVIGGGGTATAKNMITDDFSTVAGGINNRAGNDDGDVQNAGQASVGGGSGNAASGAYSTVAGGVSNTASGLRAAVGGGVANTASGFNATVPGGWENHAEGETSFAAGFRAITQWSATGTFVWSDRSANEFIGSLPNQFLVRAVGGVGINKSNPVAGTLDVNGDGLFSGNVGIGTTSPATKLEVVGTTEFGISYRRDARDARISVGDPTRTWSMATGWNTAGDFSIIEEGVAGDRLYIQKATGNVGIGTASPGDRLNVHTNDGHALVAETFDNDSHAVRGIASGAFGTGVYGLGTGFFDANIGVYGESFYYAGYFQGPVHVNGMLSKSGGSFKIDHPLDPANKYLSHSFVESPDMMNIYNGNVVTDVRGEAWVELPDYFDVLNKDFRYQLTVVDDSDGEDFVQVKISRKIVGNRFKIKSGAPGTEVSWQVTGVRRDPWAETHRLKPETEKSGPNERGLYLNPELYGQPEELRMQRPQHRRQSKCSDPGWEDSNADDAS